MQLLLKYHIWTIGCQMNKADSERLEVALDQLGFSVSETPDDANVIVLNSCVVRQQSEDKVVGMLNTLRPLKESNPERVIALMGCMVGPKVDILEKKFPHVDVFMRPQQYQPLMNIIEEKYALDTDGCLKNLTGHPKVATFIPIIHGCDKFCTFCIIPYRRGRQRSVPIDDVVREANLLAQRGVKEITLLGQTVDAYGYDLPDKPDLADLLTSMNDICGLDRIRFLTSHPNDMSDRIIDAVANLDKVCENINLPFQAGDDSILKSMRRGYTNKDYRKLVDKIRSTVPKVSISTDVIVGFSGETEEQFDKTYELIKDIRFDKVHLAKYSTREGTIASRKQPDDVPLKEKKRRLRIISELQEEIAKDINKSYLGQIEEVLIDNSKNGAESGRNRNDKLVYLEDDENRLGELVQVKINDISPWSLKGIAI